MDSNEAAAALGKVSATDSKMADRMRWPFWRHAIVGAMAGILLFAQTLDNSLNILVSGLVVVLALVVQRVDRKTHGMTVNGLRKGRTGWIALVLIVILVAAVMLVRGVIAQPQLQQPEFWLLTGGTMIATTALSYAWQGVYRAELRSGDAR